MDKILTAIRTQRDSLIEVYHQHLQAISGATRPDQAGDEMVGELLHHIADSLESGGDPQAAQHWINDGAGQDVDSGTLQAALAALEQTLMPLVTTLEAATALWQIFAQTRAAIVADAKATPERKQAEEALSQTMAVIENSPAVVFRWRADENWSVEYVSENIVQFGYTPEELMSGETPYASLVHPDDLARVAQEVADYSASGVQQFTQEYRIVTRDGQVRWTDDRTVIERDEAGNITHYQGIVIDITEQKETLLISEQQTERLAQLNEMSAAINKAESLEEVYQIAGQYTQTILGSDRASLGLVDPEGQTFEVFGLSGLKGAIPMGLHLPIDSTGVGLAIRENRVVAFPQEAPLDRYKDTGALAADGIQCTISAPLEVNGQVIGTLNVASKTAAALGNREISLMRQIIALLSSAMQMRQLWEQMKASEARFRDVALSSGDWVWEVDANGVYTYCSDRVLDVLGYTPEEVVGKTPFDFMVPDEVERVGQMFGELIATHQPLEALENRNLTKDGREVILATSGVPILDNAGDLVGYRGIDQDITERKRAESLQQELTEMLAQERTTLQAILEGLPLGVFVVEAPTGRPLITNSEAAELLGQGINPSVEKEELAEVYQAYRYGTDELYPPAQMPLVRGMTGESVTVEDMEIRKPDGERHLLRVFGAPIRNSEGEITSSVAIFQDITAQKEAELRLQQHQERLAEATAIAKLYYWEFDVATQMFTFSPEYFKALGIPITDETDFTMSVEEYAQKYIPPEEAELVGQRVGAALTSTEAEYSSEVEASNLTVDGRYIPVMVRFKLVRDNEGNPVKLIGANQDITEQKHAEETLAKQAAELQTVAEVSTRIAATRNVEELLQEVVDLTKDRFDLYHTHIYLLNEAGDTLELTAGAGEIGRKMVAERRIIPLNHPNSIVALAARTSQGTIANNVRENPDFLPHPLLPETRSELAVPMIVGERLLVVFDVQADVIDRFTEQDRQVKTTLASQVAVALENARLFTRVEQALADMQAVQQKYIQQSWEQTSREQKRIYRYDQSDSQPLAEEIRQRAKALARQKEKPELVELGPELGGVQPKSLVAPVNLSGTKIGSLQLHLAEEQVDPHSLGEEDLSLLEAILEQVAQSAENLRLFDETQQRAAQEQTIREVTDKLRAAPNIDVLLETAARELGSRLGVRHTVLELGIDNQSPQTATPLKRDAR